MVGYLSWCVIGASRSGRGSSACIPRKRLPIVRPSRFVLSTSAPLGSTPLLRGRCMSDLLGRTHLNRSSLVAAVGLWLKPRSCGAAGSVLLSQQGRGLEVDATADTERSGRTVGFIARVVAPPNRPAPASSASRCRGWARLNRARWTDANIGRNNRRRCYG